MREHIDKKVVNKVGTDSKMKKDRYIKAKWELITTQIMVLFILSLISVTQVNGDVIYSNDFNDDVVGKYTVNNLKDDWNNPSWSNGVTTGRVHIIDGSEAFEGNSMRIYYPKGVSSSGVQWQLKFGKPYNELYTSFWIKFAHDFDFVRGGKIPGLAGGSANTGGNVPDGTDGWSARMMWHSGGSMVQYVYHPDQPGKWGQSFAWNLGGQRYFKRGAWHRVITYVKINTPGNHDGIIRSWFDGELALDKRNLRFRDTNAFAIDLFYFSTFFGGSGSSYAPSSDQYAYYDDFIISTDPIGIHSPLPQETFKCSDGVDNDGDSLIDYPDDPGCSSISDNDEYNAPVSSVEGVIEAETGSLSSPMQIVSDSEASEGAYIHSTTGHTGKATYAVHIDTPGIYRIIARVYAADSSQDSFFVQIDDKSEHIWDLNPMGSPNEYNIWREDEVTKRGSGTYDHPQYDPYTVELSQGVHTISFRGREENTRFDYFILSKDSGTVPGSPSYLRVKGDK